MSGSPPSQPSLEKRGRNSNLFVTVVFLCLGFLCAAVAIEHSFSSKDTYSNWERFKHDYLKRTLDKTTNVLVLGNSKAFRGIDTSLLNKMSANAECGLRFYNGGFPGMNSAELVNHLDAVASNPNFNPNSVIFMPAVFRSESYLLSQRRRNNALIRLWRINILNLHAQNQSFRKYLNLHLSMLQRATNKSKLTRRLFFNNIEQKLPMASFLKAQSFDGYLSLSDDPRYGPGHRRQLGFINSAEAYAVLVSRLREPTSKAPHPDFEATQLNDSARKLLSLYVGKIRSLGAEPIAVHFPEHSFYPERAYYQNKFPKMREIAAVDKIEEFIHQDLWYDHEHFSKEGANAFTSIVFDQMCKR